MSSYLENNYKELFKAIVKVHRPELVVELGVLEGYSLLSMVLANDNTDCKFVGIDLFESYKFKHTLYEDTVEMFAWNKNVEIRKQDAYDAAEEFEDESIDILHVDLSNDGDILADIFDLWEEKIKKDGIVIFEGGSPERDRIEWMIKYNKTPIQNFKKFLRDRGFEYITLTPYPSLTLCRRIF